MKILYAENIFVNFVLAICIGTVKSLATFKSENYRNTLIDQEKVLKVSLTQKGYIQFLKYDITVPEFSDYTFCVWLKSDNLSHSHPLLSYSRNEKERLIRVWIVPHGSSINLELFGIKVFSLDISFVENRFYHVCQSWDSNLGVWALYLDGNLYKMGIFINLKNAVFPSKGDLVVGQEYTDFDKGLDDGIEGDISGFNMILASTFESNRKYWTFASQKSNNNLQIPNVSKLRVHNFKTISDYTAPSNRDLWMPIQKRKTFDDWYQFNGKSKLTLSSRNQKPLGLILVELTANCGYLKGAPLSGKGVLVNWTKTPVRVFGGAILKTVSPFC